jgi:hypothetical protein
MNNLLFYSLGKDNGLNKNAATIRDCFMYQN